MAPKTKAPLTEKEFVKQEEPQQIADSLHDFANDLETGRPVLSVLDDLEDAIEEWRKEYPED